MQATQLALTKTAGATLRGSLHHTYFLLTTFKNLFLTGG
jgi:hypothetical protein